MIGSGRPKREQRSVYELQRLFDLLFLWGRLKSWLLLLGLAAGYLLVTDKNLSDWRYEMCFRPATASNGMIACPMCGHENSLDADVCEECGFAAAAGAGAPAAPGAPKAPSVPMAPMVPKAPGAPQA